jgi:hypothetical protein
MAHHQSKCILIFSYYIWTIHKTNLFTEIQKIVNSDEMLDLNLQSK